MKQTYSQRGSTNPFMIATVLVGLLAVILGGTMVWALMNYFDQKNNVDLKVTAAVDEAKKQQKSVDQADFREQEKSPTKAFAGPSDFGSVTFQYPKTWSGYVAQDGVRSSSTYSAYFYPNLVPTIVSDGTYALRVEVVDRSYESIIKPYQSDVDKGVIKASAITVAGQQGVRLDGQIGKGRDGSLVIIKVRDKTLSIGTDSSKEYGSDFDTFIVKTLSFRP